VQSDSIRSSPYNHNIKKQQQQMQEDINVLPNKQTKSVLIVTAEPDVNLALKMALEQAEGVNYYFKVDCCNSPALTLENLIKGPLRFDYSRCYNASNKWF
jgi:hypothetical protein